MFKKSRKQKIESNRGTYKRHVAANDPININKVKKYWISTDNGKSYT